MRLSANSKRSIALDMTPLIDIVFQLLIFFVMTLNILPPEGAFEIRMPNRSGPSADPDTPPIMRLRLQADELGSCSGIRLNETEFHGPRRWDDLHRHVRELVGEGSFRAEAEVHIDADSDLKYENVIHAITAVSGSIDAKGDVSRLVERIVFVPR
jgi:biopolymer transport protein ExbD